MEVLTLLVAFILAISFMLAPCSASHQLNLPKPLQQVDHPKLSQPSLPRKLIQNLNHETVKTSAKEEFTQHDKFRQASSSGTKRQENEENVKTAAEKETWKWKRVEEEEEAPNKSEYFTMDYGWVRRRRPIHNKQIPFLP